MAGEGGKTNPSKKVYVAFYDEDDNEILPKLASEGGINRLVTTDIDANFTLEDILTELKILNLHMSLISDNQFTDSDVGE